MSLTKEDLAEALEPLKTDIHKVKEGLFNPDTGIYARVERNTIWRKFHMWIYGVGAIALMTAGAVALFS